MYLVILLMFGVCFIIFTFGGIGVSVPVRLFLEESSTQLVG